MKSRPLTKPQIKAILKMSISEAFGTVMTVSGNNLYGRIVSSLKEHAILTVEDLVYTNIHELEEILPRSVSVASVISLTKKILHQDD